MEAIPAQSHAPEPKRRRLRFTWTQLIVVTLLLAASSIGLAVWSAGDPLVWTANYDKEKYTQIRGAIATDPQHFRGKYFDDAIRALGLDDVPWDDIALQRSEGLERFYHFRGFALHISLETLPPGITPDQNYRAVTPNGDYPPIIGVLRLRHQPRVELDGLDRQERMKRFWKRIDEEIEIDQRRRQSRK